jgi:hypothetical protein
MAYNAAGDATITVMLPDSSIITISAPAASYSTRTFPGILSLSVTGGPVTIEIYTPDMVVDPKYLASTTATITGTVQTDIGQGTAPVSQVVLTEPLGTSYDARGRTWTLGSGDTPNRSWTLGSGDVPNRGWTLGSGDTPSRSWALGSGDNPKPFGTAGAAFNQDSKGNLLHVPTLPNSTTPIYTQASQYDVNNYPIHTIGNVTSNGTDTLAPSSYFYNGTGASGSTFINLSNAPPAGRKYEIQMLGIIIQNNSTDDTSTSIQFTTANCLAIGPGFNLHSGYAEKYTTLINNGNSSYNGTVQNETIILAWTCLPQSLLPTLVINGAPNAYFNLVYQANNGPASGDTTVVNQPLLMQAGDYFQVNLAWTGGTSNTNFLAYQFLWGVNKVLWEWETLTANGRPFQMRSTYETLSIGSRD